jgi:cytochrome c peroxidase
MMLPADMSLVRAPEFKPYVELYAKDEALFFADFASAFSKVTPSLCLSLS